jgi:carbamate kinase
MYPIEPCRYPKLVIALGGNALIRPGEAGTLPEQYERISQAMAATAAMLSAGFQAVITHGNGPVVGHLLLQMECAHNLVPPMPLFICDADSEGSLGYLIQQCLVNELRRLGRQTGVATVITQVLVAAADPAFQNPDKPIGPFYAAQEADRFQAERGWQMREDAGRGWRRLVPSPQPLDIIEQEVISYLLAGGFMVIAAGGGGVPVIRQSNGDLRGVEAVIDKDRASAVLGRAIGADGLIILTAVEQVYADYGKPGQRPLPNLSREEARRYLDEGQFAPGSMAPKIEAALDFLAGGGRRVLITRPENLPEALTGRTGTHMVAD